MTDLNKKRFFLVLILCFSLIPRCCTRYSFKGKPLPGINSVSIPIFDDRTTEFGLREKITNSVIDKFLEDNSLKVKGEREADTILHGTVLSLSDRPVSQQDDEVAQQFEIRITVKISYENVLKKKVILEEQVNGIGTYISLADRDAAIDEAVKKLSQDILDLVVSGW